MTKRRKPTQPRKTKKTKEQLQQEMIDRVSRRVGDALRQIDLEALAEETKRAKRGQ